MLELELAAVVVGPCWECWECCEWWECCVCAACTGGGGRGSRLLPLWLRERASGGTGEGMPWSSVECECEPAWPWSLFQDRRRYGFWALEPVDDVGEGPGETAVDTPMDDRPDMAGAGGKGVWSLPGG